jgi:ribosome-binding factor A
VDERRTLRVGEAIREELTEIIGFEMEDPRLGQVELTSVHISSDSKHATIKVGLHGEEKSQNQVLAVLEHASGFLRRELALRLQLRQVPELHFERDKTPDADSRIDFLLRRAKKSRARDEKQP